MAGPTEEDIAWFRSTFRPIPKPQLPDDCVEYSLYWIPLTSAPAGDVDSTDSTRNSLIEVQKYASGLVKQYLQNYIWQRDNFKLELTKEDGIHLLRGRTEYGDSIEDEWVVVYLLREVSRKFDNIWVKVTDSDGEFLLVEAAAALPAWLEPEIADNRVWINKGELVIIKPVAPSTTTEKKKGNVGKLTFRDARDIITAEPKRLMRSPTIEEEAFYRLRNYPKQIENNLHSSLVTIPRKIAHLLRTRPGYISSAIEAFYLRDPISLRPLHGKDSNNLVFEPTDFVTVSVKFTKVGFAQLKSQDFPAPARWKGRVPATKNSKDSERADMGMKLACGFEMLLSDPQNRDKQYVREMKLILEDVDTGEEALPTDTEIQTWDMVDDDESWLDISFEDLESELKGRGSGEKAKRGGDFGDKAAQENLQRIVSKFEEFLNDDTAGYDGAGLINEFGSDDSAGDTEEEFSSDGEDKEASFDEEEFSRMMKEMMGMPTASNKGPSFRPKRIQDLDGGSSDGNDDSGEIEDMSKEMEAELRQAGFFDQFNSRKATKGKTPIRGNEDGGVHQEESDDEDNLDENEVDINLARNLLESLGSQGGSSGPGSNMLGMMGMKIPKGDRK
ncbi:regulatory factor Sgt1 [Trichophyton equinum CBS 127.97]|uniref:Regulatory factor Sgt1 n=1 Tax=Trichophyton equinum (strain ATCC MYA-4606 / CBS 127.97) TaxID=559882 RepID=F2PJ01_TRIEC|nr:regulatory factor Sgt1 [Trichophyton equinum CBS 127.97]